MTTRLLWLAALVVAIAPRLAAAQPMIAPIPSGPHPRLFLDDATRAAWKAKARQSGTTVAAAVDTCKTITARPKEHERDLYMGLDWARYLQACLVAWAATGEDAHARTAIKYFTALIDDLANVGDGQGGDKAANRDSGFAIRAEGPYTAIAYDWLHDHPAMTPALRARARQRWHAWTSWYLENGYRARSPSTNYHAGYLAAATLIAIAEGNEGERESDMLWRLVADELWGKDMKAALAEGGVLDGGDWGEGWQYAPLSVVEYAASARAMAAQGVKLDRVRPWLDDVLRRHVHALSPGGGVFVGGDTQAETANLPPNPNTLAAVLLGDASPETKAWAAAEMARLPHERLDFPLWGALAEAAAVTAVPVPRAEWPTTYFARGVGTYFARTDWSKDALWMVAQCNHTIDVDHSHPNAGNFVLSRGGDDVIVDPTPYGSLATLTSNAPTVESGHLPADYKPSQAWWSLRTGFAWMRQTPSGIVAARCDYADQYKFQDRPSDVPAALRDLVLVPWAAGGGGTAIVVDRATSGDPARGLHLRFRTPARLEVAGDAATGTVGGTKVRVQTLATSGGKPVRFPQPRSSCFDPPWTRGNCAAARFGVEDWRLIVPGPTMSAIHAIDVGPATSAPPAVTLTRAGEASVVTGAGGAGFAVVVGGGDKLAYAGPAAARHVVLDGPTGADAFVSATRDGAACAVTIAGSGAGTKVSGRPRVFTLDDACAVGADVALAGTTGANLPPVDAGPITPPAPVDAPPPLPDGDAPRTGGSPRTVRSGCCGAQTAPGGSLAIGAIVLTTWLGLGVRRRRRGR